MTATDSPMTDTTVHAGQIDGAAAPTREVRRSFLWAAGLGALLAAVLFAVVMQSGRQGLFDHDLLGNFYDGQARALLDGHIAVDPDVPGIEGFSVGDRTYIYQGITPSLARIPLLVVTDRFDGRLTGVSMFLAFAVALVYLVAAGWRTRWLIRGPSPLGRLEAVCTTFATFGIGAGSMLFLGSKVWVYHEALLWGAALCLGAFTHLLYWLTPPCGHGAPAVGRRHIVQLVAAVLLAGLAVNTRSSIGMGPLVALGVTAWCLLVVAIPVGRDADTGPLAALRRWTRAISGWEPARATTRPRAAFAVIVVGVVAAVAVYAGINQARFGSMFGVPLDRQVLVATDAARREALAANDNSLFGIQYVPSVVTQVLRPDALSVQSNFPFLAFPADRPAVVGDAVFAELDWSSSVPSSETLLFLAALFGAVVLVAPRRLLRGVRGVAESHGVPLVAAVRIPAIGAAGGGAVFVVFGYIAQRYLTDLTPLLVLGALVGLHTLGGRLAARTPGRARWPVALVVAGVIITSCWTAWANTALALQYDREIAPGLTEARRAGWLRTQLRFGGDLDVLRIPADEPPGTPLPTPDGVGQVAVVGDCEAVYRSNGTVWYLLENTEPAGGLELTLDRRSPLDGPVVLAESVDDAPGSTPHAARLVLEPLGGDDVRLVVESEDDAGVVTRSLVGTTSTLPEGAPRALAMTMDQRTGNVVVTDVATRDELLRVQIALPAGRPAAVGDDEVEVTQAPLPTPLCDLLTD